MYQIFMLYTLNLHNNIHQLYLNKARKNNYPRASITQWQITDPPGWVPLLDSRDGMSQCDA